ncbi:MAG: hypothetical protein LH616_03445, partial [Ilumatobacteraceae bacterium]|nr:hypothetical protein [Ilumatobacteraceae bacterium]
MTPLRDAVVPGFAGESGDTGKRYVGTVGELAAAEPEQPETSMIAAPAIRIAALSAALALPLA